MNISNTGRGPTGGRTDPGQNSHAKAPPHQAGGIFTRPHVGLVGEAGPEAIIPLNKAKPRLLGGSITVNALITINGPVADQGNFAAILSEHSREIAEEVRRIFEIQAEQQAVV